MYTVLVAMFTCKLCGFESLRNDNIVRHMHTVHCEDGAGLVDCDIDRSSLACSSCYKSFANQYSLSRHKCKHVTSPFECPHCHKVFANQPSKSQHMKRCKERVASPKEAEPSSIQVVNNISIVNNHQYNVVFKKRFDAIQFDYSDVDSDTTVKTCLLSDDVNDCLCAYAKHVFQKPCNMCVHKQNLRVNYSKVHCGENRWRHALDEDVIPSITYNIASNFLDFLEQSTENLKNKRRMENYLNKVVSDKEPEYSDALKRIKLLLVDSTKGLTTAARASDI